MRRSGLLAAVIAAAGVSLAWSPGASARVVIDKGRIVVAGSEATTVIHRAPFRLRIENSSGRPVLREVAGPSSLSMGPVDDPIAPGFDSRTVPTLYAPLSFLVGSEAIAQYDGGFWGGNLNSGQRAGIQYAARRVGRATRVGNAVRMVLATTDPSRRR